MVAAYKTPMNMHSNLRISLNGKPTIDTGGVRRQLYTNVFDAFANNAIVKLFEGSQNHIRPMCTAQVRSCGLLKILGTMIAHSICQDGIGFPYLSPTCYAYMTGGEDKAVECTSIEDIPSDSALLISQVCLCCTRNLISSL